MTAQHGHRTKAQQYSIMSNNIEPVNNFTATKARYDVHTRCQALISHSSEVEGNGWWNCQSFGERETLLVVGSEHLIRSWDIRKAGVLFWAQYLKNNN